jgi:hypothetical protein
LEVRGDVIDALDAEHVLAATRLWVRLEAREGERVTASLNKSERGVTERRRDAEGAELATRSIDMRLNVRDRRAPALLEQPEVLVDILDLEGQGADSVRVLLQVAVRAPSLTDRRRADDRDATRLEEDALLSARCGEPIAAFADLGEVHHVDVEAARTLEITNVIVNRFDPFKSEGFEFHDLLSQLWLVGVGLLRRVGRGERR